MLSHSVLCARRGQGPPITSEMWEEMVIQGEIDRGSTEEAAAERLAGLEMPQGLGVHTAGYFQPEDQSEDCLTLTIRAPVGAANMPVMVWIHGGNHQTGVAEEPSRASNHLPDKGESFQNRIVKP